MQPNQAKPTLANNAALAGGIGLSLMTLFFFAILGDITDGSLSFLLLLGAGSILSVAGVVLGAAALMRHMPPKNKAIFGIITGMIGTILLALIIIFSIIVAMAFSSAYS